MGIKANSSRQTISRTWTDLPLELLAQIAIQLSLIDLLSFRGTCKDWRTSSSTATGENKSFSHHKPWLIVYENNTTTRQTLLYNIVYSKKYSVDIPELRGAHCLASYQGWLLLHQDCGSLFCFSPFSRARIDLPNLPNLIITDHVAAFSAPPTSEKCVICVINRQNETSMDLHVLRRGNENWTKLEYMCRPQTLDIVTGAAYDDGNFYFLDDKKKLLTYSVSNANWERFMIVESRDKNIGHLPFSCRTRYFGESGMSKLVELEDNMSISTCGTMVQTCGCPQSSGFPRVIQNETIVNGSGETENSGRLKGIWIEPLFCHIRSDQKWSL